MRAEVLLDEDHPGQPAPLCGVRDYAAAHGVDVEAAIPEGMRAKAAAFNEAGGVLYRKA